MKPRMLSMEKILIAGVMGSLDKAGDLWNDFYFMDKEKTALQNKMGEEVFEIRSAGGDNDGVCLIGARVRDSRIPPGFHLLVLPAQDYAAFYVGDAFGVDSSQNLAMNRWLDNNSESMEQATIEGQPYVVKRYGEGFEPEEDVVAELWVPLVLKRD